MKTPEQTILFNLISHAENRDSVSEMSPEFIQELIDAKNYFNSKFGMTFDTLSERIAIQELSRVHETNF